MAEGTSEGEDLDELDDGRERGGDDGSGGGVDAPRASAAAGARGAIARVAGSSRGAARRELGLDPAGGAEEMEGRVNHLEVALDAAYRRIAELEALFADVLEAVDHQASRLESIQAENHRLRAVVARIESDRGGAGASSSR